MAFGVVWGDLVELKMTGCKLTELVQVMSGLVSWPAPDILITGLSCDSRTVQPGQIFFAVPGTRDDGRRYVEEACKKGATAVVLQGTVSLSASRPQIQVQDVRVAMAQTAAFFYGYPSRQLYLCGVTGTSGKTTFTYLMERLWQPTFSGVVGTVNSRCPGWTGPANTTTPDSLVLNETFARMLTYKVKNVAVEVSSHALEQKRAWLCDFDAVVFTNLTQDHLDYHGDMESYYQSKKKLFTECLKDSCKKNKVGVINISDLYGRRLHQEVFGLGYELKTFGINSAKADLSLTSAEYSFGGTRAEFLYQGQVKKVSTNLLGEFNLHNIMAALIVGLQMTDDFESLAAKLQDIYVPGRLQRVAGKNFFVDYAHKPDALKSVLTALREIRSLSRSEGRIIAVFGCGGDRDKGKRPLMGKIAARMADVVCITSDNPRTESPPQIIEDILTGIKGAISEFNGLTGYLVEADRERALKMAVEIAGPQDIVLVAGKGHEDYQIVGTEKRHFDDREILDGLLT